MRQINFGMTLSLSLITLFLLSSCSSIRPEKEIVTVTEFVQTKIPIVLHPKPVNLNDVKIYVVSPSENFEEFMSEFEKKNGRSVTILGDQQVPYEILRSVMASCSEENYRDIALAVNQVVSGVVEVHRND